MQMDMDVSLGHVQKLILTPQVELSLNILKMSTDELNNLIDEELLSNPLLAYSEQENENFKPREGQISYHHSDWEGGKRKTDNGLEEYIKTIPDSKSVDISLKKYLLLQLHTHPSSKKNHRIAEFLIECLEDNGYLNLATKEIACVLQVEEIKVERIVKMLQCFEPAGVFARSVQECLLLQVTRNPSENQDIILLIKDYLYDIADNKIPKICMKTGFGREYVLQLINRIRQLNPYPGNVFSDEEDNRYLYPDITVRQNKDSFCVYFNKERICQPQLNNDYMTLMKKDGLEINDKSYIQEQYNEAKFLLRCINQREDTMKKVMEAILMHQRAFFEKGKMYLKPLTLRDIAEEIEMHESTVSRAVRDKYVECKWGIFELKYFFSNKSPGISDGKTEVTNVHMCIKEIVDKEDKGNPLSDTQIADYLEQQKIHISRRTVAKYRMQLNILNAGLRKDYES